MTLTRVPAGLCILLQVPDGIPLRACWLGSWQSTSRFWLLQEMAGAFEDWQGQCGHTLPTKVYEDGFPPRSPHSTVPLWMDHYVCLMRGTGIFRGTSSKLQGCALPSLSLTLFETIFGVLPESSHYLTTEWFLLSLMPLGEDKEARAPDTKKLISWFSFSSNPQALPDFSGRLGLGHHSPEQAHTLRLGADAASP